MCVCVGGGVVHSMCINTHVLLHECVCVGGGGVVHSMCILMFFSMSVCVCVWGGGGSSFDVYKYSCSSP